MKDGDIMKKHFYSLFELNEFEIKEFAEEYDRKHISHNNIKADDIKEKRIVESGFGLIHDKNEFYYEDQPNRIETNTDNISDNLFDNNSITKKDPDQNNTDAQPKKKK